MRENPVPGEKCVRNQLPVDKGQDFVTPLHIKLSLMKNFAKAMKNVIVLSI
jgi:hypothetical protein